MSVRGPRGGRGRGRGRGKTMVWEWETYRPPPSVYSNIWHIRQAPVAVTPTPPAECPVANARTRILERRQTEDGFGRNFYLVEIARDDTEVLHVDASRILAYASPRELERFENEQFRLEAAAQAVADCDDAEELVRRRLARNARVAGSGRGRGRSLLIVDPDLRAESTAPSRGRGTGRGRCRGRRRGRGRAGLHLSHRELSLDAVGGGEHGNDLPVPDEPASPVAASPSLMRSAFVASSALSPNQSLHRSHPEVPDVGDTDSASTRSLSDGLSPDGHRTKRRRTESMTRRTESITPQHTLMFPPSSQMPDDSDSDDDAEEYAIEAIIEHYNDDQDRKFYLVKWEGYDNSYDWLPEEDLEGAAELVDGYNACQRAKSENLSNV